MISTSAFKYREFFCHWNLPSNPCHKNFFWECRDCKLFTFLSFLTLRRKEDILPGDILTLETTFKFR